MFPRRDKYDNEIGAIGGGNNFTDRDLSLRLVSTTELSDPGKITLSLCVSDFSIQNED